MAWQSRSLRLGPLTSFTTSGLRALITSARLVPWCRTVVSPLIALFSIASVARGRLTRARNSGNPIRSTRFCQFMRAPMGPHYCDDEIRRRMSRQESSISTRPMAIRPPSSAQFGAAPRRAISRNRSVP